ncbi:MAG: response regulator [Candidatus Peregrinibacteria bacterium]|nr:response regulator [Candidatus Peregrinibacteria bacterium]
MHDRHFLIADDSEAKMFFLASIVKKHWAGELHRAKSTEEAKKLIDAHPEIAAAFIDYEIPSENGPAVIRYLRGKNPQAKIALVTAFDSPRYGEDAKSAGADAFVTTSQEMHEVAESLENLLQLWAVELEKE